MSHVTDILLITCFDDPGIPDIQRWLRSHDWPELVEISGHAGGDKAMQCDVWAAAINLFNIDEFVEAVKSAKWEYGEDVQLYIKDENDDRFELRSGLPTNSNDPPDGLP